MIDRLRPAETQITQKLRTEIERGVPFGQTTTGSDWCVKALHPSDPLTEVRGIPDQSAVPTVCLNYQSVFTLSIAPGQVTPWSFDMTMLPHPYYIASWDAVKAYCPESGTNAQGNFWNTQLVQTGQGMAPVDSALYLAWTNLALRWRLAYMSVTVYQDGPDLANQGTIVVSQAPITPVIVGGSSMTIPGNPPRVATSCPIAMFNPQEEGPNFSRSQAMPNAMMGKSKEGAYVPLKLTDTVQDWHTTRDDYGVMELGKIAPPDSAYTGVQVTLVPAWPFWFQMPMVMNPVTNTYTGNRIVDLMQDNVAHISARNLADTTSYAFHFRMGIEAQLAPSSTLTPQLKLSPPYDPVALETYFRLSRELKDGYPADYNDFGKMWDAISAAVATLKPALNALLPGLGSAAGGVAKLGDTIRARRKARRGNSQIDRNELTQANLERVSTLRAMESAVAALPQRRRRARAVSRTAQVPQQVIIRRNDQPQRAVLVESQPEEAVLVSSKGNPLRVVRTTKA